MAPGLVHQDQEPQKSPERLQSLSQALGGNARTRRHLKWAIEDLNLRLLPCEDSALPAELIARVVPIRRKRWTVGGSNSRPLPCEGSALPAELTARHMAMHPSRMLHRCSL